MAKLFITNTAAAQMAAGGSLYHLTQRTLD
jgi:hypothetical protein